MSATWRDIADLLVDPIDHAPLAATPAGDALVSTSGNRYAVVHGNPVLLPPHGLVLGGWSFPPITVDDADRPKPARVARTAARRSRRAFEAAGDRHLAVEQLAAELRDRPRGGRRAVVLVVGGATVGQGLDDLLATVDADVVAFDIYPTGETTFVADADRIPLADGTVAAVCVQAVLEHVYRPDVVVAEIRRVLEPGGLVYAETPFLQPVHEGAYDFTRFTVSGHRMLFDGFDHLASGPIGGPGAMANLAVRGLVGGLTRSRALAKLAYALTLPLRLLDRPIPPRARADFCIGAYLLARRSSSPVAPIDPVAIYDDQR